MFYYSSFVYDYYSDLELTFEYYNGAFVDEALKLNDSARAGNVTEASGEGCSDITRQPNEFRTAFITNLCCIAVPLVIFYVMCARELLVWLIKVENQVKARIQSPALFLFVKGLGRILWLCPVSVICAPFFILYVAVRQV